MEKVERGLEMVLHSFIIGLILYMLMVFVLKQKEEVAENRSILISAFALIYMVVFGHGLPNKINKDL
jgi:hypothetical protein